MTTTHLAGPLVVFSKLDRAIQRCAVCGEVLEDMQPSCISVVSTRSDDHGLPQFAEAHLIEATEGNPKQFLDLGDFTKVDLPNNFCLALVERARR
jgi:hypothetical protein